MRSRGRIVPVQLPVGMRRHGACQTTLRDAVAAVGLPYDPAIVQALADAGLLHLEGGRVRIDALDSGAEPVYVPETPELCSGALDPDHHQIAEDPGRGAGAGLQELLQELLQGAGMEVRPGVVPPELGGVP